MESRGPSPALTPTRNSKLTNWKALQGFWKNLPVTLEKPLLATSDKHKGSKKALREISPHTFRHPCLAQTWDKLAQDIPNLRCKLPNKIENGSKGPTNGS